MGDVRSLVGTIASNVVSAAAGFGAGAGPVARFITGARSVAGLAAGIENLLTAVAAEVALTASIAGLAMVDAGLPFVAVAAAGDRMRGSIPRRVDVDVVATPAPVDVAAPIPSRPPITERPTGAKGQPGRKEAITDVGGRRPIVGWIIR